MDEEKLNTPLVSKETADSAVIVPQAAGVVCISGGNVIATAAVAYQKHCATPTTACTATDVTNTTTAMVAAVPVVDTTNVNLNVNTQLSIGMPQLIPPTTLQLQQKEQQPQQQQQLTLLPYSNQSNLVGNHLKNGALSYK
ncbi:uncharacterized protein LOC118740541 [Rhagoletis pomonella]|uniref:uncharacterized protein LOC118740541 n=1 Tax=Rhagoletis pomonella TaxID=28610 RepID=UPI00177DEF04|nr:uncharacterized protein LOC118740541 [Rhagoletis pomonella]XP_036328011.1 uncharacterized protein LOC118740541 [Rhagoletis pomonella]